MRRDRKYPFLIVLTIVLSCLALFFAVKFVSALIDRLSPQPSQYDEYIKERESREWQRTIKYNGKKYHVKSGLTTLMLLGVDNANAENTTSSIGTRGRTDAIMLLLLDDSTKTIQTLSISRDTMTTVEAYSTDGQFLYAGQMQITLQYGFGDGPRRCNYLAKKCVSNLLHGMYIDGVMSMTMDAIPTVVDLMGGLKLTFEDDYSYIDPAYTKGATVTLDGAQAERFVRYRDIEQTGSNELRVARQTWLVEQMFTNLRSFGGSDFIDEVLDKAGRYIESDISAENLKKIATYKFTGDMLKLPGKATEGDHHDEFIYDEDALQKMIIDLFYEEVKD